MSSPGQRSTCTSYGDCIPLIATRSPGLAPALKLRSSRKGNEKQQRPFAEGLSQGGMGTSWFPQEEEGSVGGVRGWITSGQASSKGALRNQHCFFRRNPWVLATPASAHFTCPLLVAAADMFVANGNNGPTTASLSLGVHGAAAETDLLSSSAPRRI